MKRIGPEILGTFAELETIEVEVNYEGTQITYDNKTYNMIEKGNI